MKSENYTIGLKIDIKNERDKNKEYIVYVYVSSDGKRKYFNTGVKCKLKYFNGENVVGLQDARRLNIMITDKIMEVERLVEKCKINGKFQIDTMKILLDEQRRDINICSTYDMFLDWCTEMNKNINVSQGTKNNNRATINVLKRFGKIKYFKDLTLKNIISFDEYIKKEGYKDYTIEKFHKKIKMFVRKAILEGYNIDDPYQKFKIKRAKPDMIRYISEEELKKLVNFKSRNKALQKTRDMFVFQCYTGLAYSDMVKIKKEDVMQEKGKYYIIDKRVKTLQKYMIRLYPEALTILRRNKYDMNLMCNQQYNRMLKCLATILDIRKDLTSHMARHTFATIALNNGIPLSIVARMLGHASTNCTEIYAQYQQRTIEVNGYDKLEQFFV